MTWTVKQLKEEEGWSVSTEEAVFYKLGSAEWESPHINKTLIMLILYH